MFDAKLLNFDVLSTINKCFWEKESFTKGYKNK
jgi:hypothetical protein